MGRVEVFRTGRSVTVYSDGLPVQAWAVDEWDELLAAIKAGDDCLPEIEVLPTGDVWLGFQYSGRHEILSFTEAEWAEFVAGVRAGKFDIDKLSGPAAAKGLATAGQVGSATGAGADRAATEAGAAGNPPAPVAAEVLGPLPVKPRPMSGAGSGHDASLLTDGQSVLPGAHTHFSGPNVASMNVPAGRDLTGETSSPGSSGAIATTDQPGPGELIDLVRPDFLTGVDVDEWGRDWARGAYGAGFIAGLRVAADEVDYAREWAKRTAPLVPEVVEASRGGGTAEATGGAPPDRVGVSGGKAGPGSTPRAPGPAEPPCCAEKALTGYAHTEACCLLDDEL